VFFTALIFSMSAAVAHADPGFVLAESQARAGDAVHFSITGADDRVTYELEVAGREVLEGEADADGNVISGQFTMPHLGGSPRSVEVEAEIREPDDRTTVTRKLQYVGPALVAPTQSEPQPAAAPVVPQQAAPAPASAQTPAATERTSSPAPKVKHRSKRPQRRHRRARRTVARHRGTPSSKRRAGRRSHEKPKRTKRAAPRTAPLFDGVPEPDSGGYSAVPDEESSAREAGPPAAVLTTPVASRDGGEPAAAILVPGLLGLAGFILAIATLLRRRRSG
jgi:translation initiation factor IF-2